MDVTITADRAAYCFTLMAFSREGSLSCHTYCDLGLYGLIRKTGTHVPQWDSNQGCKDH
jgi:hypothetical protein